MTHFGLWVMLIFGGIECAANIWVLASVALGYTEYVRGETSARVINSTVMTVVWSLCVYSAATTLWPPDAAPCSDKTEVRA